MRGAFKTLVMGVGLLALLSPLSAQAQDKRESGSSLEAPAIEMSDEEINELFTEFAGKIAAGDQQGGLNALAAILNDPQMAPAHGRAWVATGNILKQMGHEYAALTAWGEAIKSGDPTAKDIVKPALELADKVNDVALLEQAFAKNVGLAVDKETRSHMAYLAARGAYADGGLSTSLGILALVDKNGPDYGKAMAFKGVVLSQQGKYTSALTSLLAAEQILGDDPETLDVVELNIGRVYYAMENWGFAMTYFEKVDRGSHWWPEAQFERAWAHFRFQDVNGALGILHTHVSPFYEDWYFPEAQLLRTYSLFLICKFPEASKQIDAFQAHWTPVRDSAQSALAGMSDKDAFEDARAFVNGEDATLDAMFLRDYPYDQGLLAAIEAADAAQAELGALDSKSGEWTRLAKDLVKARQKELVLGSGKRIKSKADYRVDELTQMLNDTEISKLDMLSLQTKLYEQASTSGEIADVDRKAMRDVRVRKGYRAWPYQGEMWADELGYYRVNAKPECPQGLMQGG